MTEPGVCLAYQELEEILEHNISSGIMQTERERVARLEWLLTRHSSDGTYGCDWCVLAEEIRRLRAVRFKEGA